MSIFNLPQSNSHLPKYLQLAHVVRNAIREGKLSAGDHLPSAQSLSNDLAINRHTVMKSFGELIAEGWIESIERVGYRVLAKLPVESSKHSPKLARVNGAKSAERKPVNTLENYRLLKKGSSIAAKTAEQYQYNFAGGQPDLHNFPFTEFKRYMSASLTRPNISEYGYGGVSGTTSMRTQGYEYLRKSRGIVGRDIVITNGSQEALYIIAHLFLQAGDKVAVEALAYPPAMAAFASAGASIKAIKQDTEGMKVKDLEAQINLGNIRLIYLTPLHQYPTTVTLSVNRRMQIYALATKHNIPIIEDDYDHEFHYKSQPLAPLAANDPNHLVIYIATFSKIMFPGVRIGIMALPTILAQAVAEYRLLMSNKPNVLMQEALANWMQSGGFERHLRRTTRTNEKRRDHAIACIEELKLFEFKIPYGGMALWLRIKNGVISANELAQRCRQADIFIQHEQEFHVNKLHNKNQHIRIGFAGMPEHKFAKGLAKIASFINP